MAFNFYNRYIPPPESSTLPQQSDRPQKKRKISKSDNGHHESIHADRDVEEEDPEPTSNSAVAIETSKAKQLKKKNKKKSRNDHAVLPMTDAMIEGPTDVSTKVERGARKHEAILTKYNTSTKTEKGDVPIDDNVVEPDGSEEQTVEHHGLEPLPQPDTSQTVSKSSAPTGSGKTLAYAVPISDCFRNCTGKLLTALIIVPTRELVGQAKEMLNACIGSNKAIQIATADGSRPFKEEQIALVQKYQRYDPEAYEAEEQEVQVRPDNELFYKMLSNNFGLESDCHGIAYDDERMLNHVYDYQSKATVLISTPGRLVEHLKSTKGFTLRHVELLVIDEADRILDDSFQDWLDAVMPDLERPPEPLGINKILEDAFLLPLKKQARKIILSASMTKDVSKLAGLNLRTPQLLVLEDPYDDDEESHLRSGAQGQSYTLPSSLRENAVSLTNVDTKPLELIRVMESAQHLLENREKEASQSSDEDASPLSDSDSSISPSHPPSNQEGPHAFKIRGTLVFTKSTESAHRLFRLLTLLRPEYSSQIATFTKSSANIKTLKRFAKQKISILIATDRASRGLDIPHLEHVINYDMPSSQESYVHRVGRTARAGKAGLATTLVAHHQARWFWNEIARGPTINRQGKRIERWNLGELKLSEEESKKYEKAITELGEEVRGK
ncbi:MAG: ATP-dependent RNA helicase dbp6 [Ramalina farinacea]|uniref:ATP-dependent RNA helicase n=1 Tax=Ramalina farinacea TaxID=258253 RepID=A0AA43QNQ6_9LECA|nr:ATP-dependent RNA helicase dbp6 [Ramalina farinacea]